MRISLHSRVANFVQWIRPDPDKEPDARKQRDEVRDRIRRKAVDDGLTVRSTPDSGSFAKSTGLRRHMLGDAEHEGQDIDLPFVVSPKDEDGDVLTELLRRFDSYVEQSYPDTPRETTRSSIRLDFVASKRAFDVVPMLAVPGRDDEQVLLRSDGQRRRTSIQKHIEFSRSRTRKSQDLRGPVAFNDAVRLVKWWREWQATKGGVLDEVPTFLVELLCSKAFDETSVRPTYPETLANWFDKLYSYAYGRTTVSFRDYSVPQPEAIAAKWKVIDPVNGTNNVVPDSWGGMQIDELRDWAREARDNIRQAIAYDMRDRGSEAVEYMSQVFGPSFKNHSVSA